MASKVTFVTAHRGANRRVRPQTLRDCFQAVEESVVTCVQAPAGFGKTAALDQWSGMFDDRDKRVIRVSGRGKAPDLATSAAMLAEKDGAVLMIDDAHLLDEETRVGLSELIRSAGDHSTFVVAARGLVDLPLSRLRAAGRVLTIGADKLRMTASETAQLLAARSGGPVDVEWAAFIHQLAAGWSAGIMLAAIPSSGGGSRDAAARTAFAWEWQRLVNLYFAEEVLPGVDYAFLRAMQRLSIVPDGVPASACSDPVAATATLERMAEAGLFVTRADGASSLSIDPLFRQALRDSFSHRDPAAFAAAHWEAASHYEAVGEPQLAIHVAQASGDAVLLATTLERTAEQLCYSGRVEQVVAVAASLEEDRLRRSPAILMCLAWWRMRALDIPSAEQLLCQAEAAILIVENGTLESPHDPAFLRLLLRHRHAMLLGARDDLVAAEREADALLTDLGDDYPYLSCTMLAQLMTARREFFDLPDALRMEGEARRATARAGSRFAAIGLQASVAPTLALQGRTATARAMLEQAVELAAQFGGLTSGLSALPALPLAELYYDLGDVDKASALAHENLPAARAFLHLDQLFPGHLIRARVLAARGQIGEALKVIEEAHVVALECGLPRMRRLAMAAQVELLLRHGQPHQAEQAYRVIVPDVDAEPMPRGRPTRCDEAVALAWLRLQLRHLNLGAVRRVAHCWRETVWRANSLRSVVQFELILAQVSVLDGKMHEAKRHLRDALTIAAEPGWTQLFLDEGEVIVELLCSTYRHGEPGHAPADRLAGRLLIQIGKGHRDRVTEGSSERLAPREVEVLVLVADGLHNREIGDRLGLTEGTVKWYMQQVYDKLGVRRRPQAVTRARLLGLMA